MKLLTELTEQVSFISEGEGQSKKHFLEGVFMQANVPNKNKRIYPIKVLTNEVNRYIKENIENNRAYGELAHPTGPNINPDRICIHIKSLKSEGNNFIGKALIASTPMGNIVKGLIEDGANLGVSSRALGTLKPLKEGLNEVSDDLRLLAVDVVCDPSAPDAYVSSVMEEREWVFNPLLGEWTLQIVEAQKAELRRSSLREIETRKLRMFREFMENIANK